MHGLRVQPVLPVHSEAGDPVLLVIRASFPCVDCRVDPKPAMRLSRITEAVIASAANLRRGKRQLFADLYR